MYSNAWIVVKPRERWQFLTDPLHIGRLPVGRYAKGADTRAHIVRIATELFAREGYARASTRSIAVAANVNSASLQYYFDTKAGLFHECLEQIVERIEHRFGPLYVKIRDNIQSEDDDCLIEDYCILGDWLIESYFADDEGVLISAFAGKSAVLDRPDTWNLMRNRVIAPIVAITSDLIRRIVGLSEDDPATAIHAKAASGICGIFYHERAHAGGAWADEPPREDIETIKRVVRLQNGILLRGMRESIAHLR